MAVINTKNECNHLEITTYYAALNELAAMLQDKQISYDDWSIQSAMMHMYWKDK